MRHLAAALLLALLARSSAAANEPEIVNRAATEDPQVLIARWWQWRLALPEMATPDEDPTGRFCAAGQSGDVWFLAGHLSFGAGSKASGRTCAVPAGKKIFFPIVTIAKFVHGSVDCGLAKAQVVGAIDSAADLSATLDGAPLPDLGHRRVATDSCFPVTIAANAKSADAAADGYWLMLSPSRGKHVLQYGSRYADGSKNAEEFQRTSYLLDVE